MRLCFTLLAIGLMAGFSTLQAGTIVPDLSDSDASLVYSDTVVGSTIANYFAPTLADGVTLAAKLTPTQVDIDMPAESAVAVIETGGTTSGSGIWLLGGEYWFLTSNGNAGALPADADGGDSGIGVSLGSAVPGQENLVWASFDGANGGLKGSVNGVVTEYPLANVGGGWNWGGNKSVSFGEPDPTLTGANYGWRGGLVDNLTSPALYDTNSAVSLDGTVALGQIYNTVSATPVSVPEPSSLLIAGLMAAGLIAYRRS
ncbi:hypothetical protein [Aeoliella mucimassa]|uniref:PEP-CTERM protein-sorting domain-containing protein n=1 Tax=Aeoliella mucimassa TaxID=2527972 RepID=A0A518ANL9_9BACT|nr:hypothetical protein [Aeoliella mucimassa]QDU56319.1 hypothetical protein Pan181_25280 [Aeoliella mucimassa]